MNMLVTVTESPPEGDDVYLRPGDAFELAGKVFVVQSRCSRPQGYVVIDPEAPSVEHPMAARDIKAWYVAGKLSFMSRDEFGLPVGVRHNLRRSLRSFSSDERSEVIRRLRYCRAIDDLGERFGRSEATLQPVCDGIAAARGDVGPHDWRSVYRWWGVWARAGRDPRALCPSHRRRGNRTRRFERYQLDAMELAIREHYLRRHQPSMATAHKACVANIVKALGGPAKARAVAVAMANDETGGPRSPFPSLKAFRAECKRHSRVVRIARRQGPDAARQAMYPVGLGPDVRLPFERVEADFKYLRLFVVDDGSGLPLGTPYLMAAIDCYSGCIAGWDVSFDPPSYVSAARALRHVIGFKDLSDLPLDEDGEPIVRNDYPLNGVPHMFFVDHDQVFHSSSFVQSAGALGCHVDYVPPSQSWKKGRIERFWQTLERCFLDMFPGKVLRPAERPGRDYKPDEDAVVTLTQLRLLITKAVVDVYHQEIDPETSKRRIDVWNDGVSRDPTRRVRQHDDILELIGAYETRTAERRGLRLFGLRYNSPELAMYRAGFESDPRVEVRYDPHDIGFVTLVDRDRGITFRVPCTRPDYATGLRLHQHLVIKRRAKDNGPEGRVRMADLLLAKAALFALGETMLKKRRNRGSLGKVAQFLGVGRELIDQISNRRDDIEESERHLALSDEGVQDPDDELAARQDEMTVKSLQSGARASSGGPGARAGRGIEPSPAEPMLREETVSDRPVASGSPVPVAGSPEGDTAKTATSRRAQRESRKMKVDLDD